MLPSTDNKTFQTNTDSTATPAKRQKNLSSLLQSKILKCGYITSSTPQTSSMHHQPEHNEKNSPTLTKLATRMRAPDPADPHR
jgi:hypothetical protein